MARPLRIKRGERGKGQAIKGKKQKKPGKSDGH